MRFLVQLKDFIRASIPTILLEKFRAFKKKKIAKTLKQQRQNNSGLSKQDVVSQLQNIGIKKGDVLLVHASFSKIGLVNDGAEGFIDALLETIGETGNLLMPSSSNPSLQIVFLQNTTLFDAKNDPSVMGILSETMRKRKMCARSLHPTESVLCLGPDAEFFTAKHHTQITAYDTESPWYKVAQKRGKILFIGIGIERCTSLHLVEDASENFPFPVYLPEMYTIEVKDLEGVSHQVHTKVHNPEISKKRQCRALIPFFKAENVWSEHRLGNATCELLDAKLMFDTMLKGYQEKGITMYTPNGSK
jgi:aminoglycoside 3-N-acetyltransferase